jgi:hypothetical protein
VLVLAREDKNKCGKDGKHVVEVFKRKNKVLCRINRKKEKR